MRGVVVLPSAEIVDEIVAFLVLLAVLDNRSIARRADRCTGIVWCLPRMTFWAVDEDTTRSRYSDLRDVLSSDCRALQARPGTRLSHQLSQHSGVRPHRACSPAAPEGASAWTQLEQAREAV